MAHISKMGIPVLAAIWFAVALAGFRQLDGYSNTPAASGNAVQSWPRMSNLDPDSQKPTFVMFIHPHCPCSAASVHSLLEIMREHSLSSKFIVVFVRPKGVAPKWELSATHETCLKTPGLTTIVDDQGKEATLFGALTSGQTYIFSPNHELVFSGGITSARGMEEVGPERKLVINAILGQTAHTQHTPVFGCSLQ